MKRWPFPRHLARIRDIVVYHKKDNSGKRLERSFSRSAMIFDAAKNLRWYSNDYFWPVACTGTPELEGDDPIIEADALQARLPVSASLYTARLLEGIRSLRLLSFSTHGTTIV
jgi:hypothetical protein